MGEYLEFIETEVFTECFKNIGDDKSLRALQYELNKNPEKGNYIAKTSGLRKLRIALPGKGKSGGARILYLFVQVKERIYLIYAFKKNEMKDIPEKWKKRFKKLVEAFGKEK